MPKEKKDKTASDDAEETKGNKKDKGTKNKPKSSPKGKDNREESKSKTGRKKKSPEDIKAEEEKKENAKKLKDPGAPKKALSSYILFGNEVRPRIMKDNPGKGVGEIGKLIGNEWNSLTSKQKEKYEKMHEEDKKR